MRQRNQAVSIVFYMAKGKGGTKPIEEAHAARAREALARYVDSVDGGQKKAAPRLGVSQGTLSRYISGQLQMGLAILVALRRVSKTPIDDILELEPLDFESDDQAYAFLGRAVARTIPLLPPAKGSAALQGRRRGT